MEWQPIETLKNDTYKRQYVLFGFFHEKKYCEDYQNNENADCFIQLGYFYMGTISGVVCGAPDNHCVSLGMDVKPTHWMPLPPPPKE